MVHLKKTKFWLKLNQSKIITYFLFHVSSFKESVLFQSPKGQASFSEAD